MTAAEVSMDNFFADDASDQDIAAALAIDVPAVKKIMAIGAHRAHRAHRARRVGKSLLPKRVEVSVERFDDGSTRTWYSDDSFIDREANGWATRGWNPESGDWDAGPSPSPSYDSNGEFEAALRRPRPPGLTAFVVGPDIDKASALRRLAIERASGKSSAGGV